MSDSTRYSQWVPFEVGMSAQNDMPTATFLQENVALPDFLEYWPRLKQPSDIKNTFPYVKKFGSSLFCVGKELFSQM